MKHVIQHLLLALDIDGKKGYAPITLHRKHTHCPPPVVHPSGVVYEKCMYLGRAPREGAGAFMPRSITFGWEVNPATGSRHVQLVGRVLLGLIVALTASAAFAGDPPSKAADEKVERAKFVGLWKGFTVEGKGENPDRGPVKLEITITEKTMHGIQITDDGNIDHGVGEYTLNLAADPAQLDAAKTGGRGRKQAYVGIYKLEGDTLKSCVSPQKVRPETFETKKGQFLVILKRHKAKP